MTIEEKLALLPHTIVSLGKTGELYITNAIEKERSTSSIDFDGYWLIEYIGEDKVPIESVYEKTSQVYLISFFKGFENTLDDMLDRLKQGGIING